MNMNEIKEKIESNEYAFLKTNPVLNDHICLLTVGGSYAYGTNISNNKSKLLENYVSDLDIRGIYLPSKEEILSMSVEEDLFEDKQTDTCIFSFKKIIKLLKECNPNILEIFGVNDEHVLYSNDIAKLLSDNIGLFLSKQVISSYGNYASQQLRLCEKAMKNNSLSKKTKIEYTLDKLNDKIDTFSKDFENLSHEKIQLYIDDSTKDGVDKEIFMDLNLKHFPITDFKESLGQLHQIIKYYKKNNVNEKPQIKVYKNLMHLIRLLISGAYILQTGKLKTYMGEDRELLLKIRNGEISVEKIFELTEHYKKIFEEAAETTKLPDAPDYVGINKLITEISQKILAV